MNSGFSITVANSSLQTYIDYYLGIKPNVPPPVIVLNLNIRCNSQVRQAADNKNRALIAAVPLSWLIPMLQGEDNLKWYAGKCKRLGLPFTFVGISTSEQAYSRFCFSKEAYPQGLALFTIDPSQHKGSRELVLAIFSMIRNVYWPFYKTKVGEPLVKLLSVLPDKYLHYALYFSHAHNSIMEGYNMIRSYNNGMLPASKKDYLKKLLSSSFGQNKSFQPYKKQIVVPNKERIVPFVLYNSGYTLGTSPYRYRFNNKLYLTLPGQLSPSGIDDSLLHDISKSCCKILNGNYTVNSSFLYSPSNKIARDNQKEFRDMLKDIQKKTEELQPIITLFTCVKQAEYNKWLREQVISFYSEGRSCLKGSTAAKVKQSLVSLIEEFETKYIK